MYTFYVYYDENPFKEELLTLVFGMKSMGLNVILNHRKEGLHRKRKHRLTTVPQMTVVADDDTVIHKHGIRNKNDLHIDLLFGKGGKLSEESLNEKEVKLREKIESKLTEKIENYATKVELISALQDDEKNLSKEELKAILLKLVKGEI